MPDHVRPAVCGGDDGVPVEADLDRVGVERPHGDSVADRQPLRADGEGAPRTTRAVQYGGWYVVSDLAWLNVRANEGCQLRELPTHRPFLGGRDRGDDVSGVPLMPQPCRCGLPETKEHGCGVAVGADLSMRRRDVEQVTVPVVRGGSV